MAYADVMNKVRHFDNKAAKWMTRHFYILFFEGLLVFIFTGLFVITLKAIDLSEFVARNNIMERLFMLQTFNGILITLLLLLNSFWMLYIFSGMLRIRSLLRELNFHLTRKGNESAH